MKEQEFESVKETIRSKFQANESVINDLRMMLKEEKDGRY